MGNIPTSFDGIFPTYRDVGGLFTQTMGGVGRGSVTVEAVGRTASSLVRGRVRGWHVVFVAVVELVRGSLVEWTCAYTGQAGESASQSWHCVGRVLLPF